MKIYSRPRQIDVDNGGDIAVACCQCGEYNTLGTWVGLKCWEPMTIAGIHDRQGFILNKFERDSELLNRYGLTPKEIEALCNKPASNVTGLASDGFSLRFRAREEGVRFPA